jgi:hypothetical protein
VNLWNRDPLASAATSHARALQPAGGGRRSPFRLELEADRGTAQVLEIQENRGPGRCRMPPVETMSHGREKRSYGLSVCRAGVVRRGRSMLTLAEHCWPILSLASLEREGDR